MPLCPIHHCMAWQPRASSVQTDPEVMVMTAQSMPWLNATPGAAIASLPWPSGTFPSALWGVVAVRRVHRRGAPHHRPTFLPPSPHRPAES